MCSQIQKKTRLSTYAWPLVSRLMTIDRICPFVCRGYDTTIPLVRAMGAHPIWAQSSVIVNPTSTKFSSSRGRQVPHPASDKYTYTAVCSVCDKVSMSIGTDYAYTWYCGLWSHVRLSCFCGAILCSFLLVKLAVIVRDHLKLRGVNLSHTALWNFRRINFRLILRNLNELL